VNNDSKAIQRAPEGGLTPVEWEELARHEQVISGGLQTFVQVGQALAEIRDRRLYRANYRTFEDYCRRRWSFTRQRAHQLIEAAAVVEDVSTVVDVLPANEAQARELTALKDPEERQEAWREATSGSKGKPVTAAAVKNAVADVRRAKRRTPGEREPPGAVITSKAAQEEVEGVSPPRRPDYCILTRDLEASARALVEFYDAEELQLLLINVARLELLESIRGGKKSRVPKLLQEFEDMLVNYASSRAGMVKGVEKLTGTAECN
jgi:hypothetical protein